MDTGSSKPNPARDEITAFFERAATSVVNGSFIRLRLMSPRDSSEAGHDVPARVDTRLVALKGRSVLSVVEHFPRRDVTCNHEIDAGWAWLRVALERGFTGALLCTTESDWQLVTRGKWRMVKHPASCTTAPSLAHDAAKVRCLGPASLEWFKGLGIVQENGAPRASMAAKRTQIERYAELVAHIARDEDWGVTSSWTVADFGSGKGYLTFAAWEVLARTLGRQVRVVGVEQRQDLVDQTNALARKIGASGLEFATGRVDACELPKLDAVIALHACDTATDAAIGRGIRDRARWIAVAPCCQHEVRRSLRDGGVLAPLLRHGILAERLSEWLTDGLRSLYLEAAGYNTRVMEFVDTEHTPKNLLLSAVREVDARPKPAAAAQIEAIKTQFGLGTIAMDRWVDLDVVAASTTFLEPGSHA